MMPAAGQPCAASCAELHSPSAVCALPPQLRRSGSRRRAGAYIPVVHCGSIRQAAHVVAMRELPRSAAAATAAAAAPPHPEQQQLTPAFSMLSTMTFFRSLTSPRTRDSVSALQGGLGRTARGGGRMGRRNRGHGRPCQPRRMKCLPCWLAPGTACNKPPSRPGAPWLLLPPLPWLLPTLHAPRVGVEKMHAVAQHGPKLRVHFVGDGALRHRTVPAGRRVAGKACSGKGWARAQAQLGGEPPRAAAAAAGVRALDGMRNATNPCSCAHRCSNCCCASARKAKGMRLPVACVWDGEEAKLEEAHLQSTPMQGMPALDPTVSLSRRKAQHPLARPPDQPCRDT